MNQKSLVNLKLKIGEAEMESYLDISKSERSKYIATFREFAKDYAKILSNLDAKKIYYVSATLKGVDYKIYNVSVFDELTDATKKYLQISGRHMQDATLFFLQFARDTLSNLRITATKGRSYLIEPRLECLTWTAKRLGLANRKELARVITGGGLQDILTTDFDKLKNKQKNKVKDTRHKVSTYKQFHESEKLETELSNLKLREMAILQKLDRTLSLNLKSKDERIRWQDERIAQLRHFITGNGLQIPGPIVTQASWYANRARNKDQDLFGPEPPPR